MHKFAFIILLLLNSTNGLTQKKQQHYIDSLTNLLNSSQQKQSASRACTLSNLGKAYLITSNYVQSMQCFYEELSIAEKLDKDDLKATGYLSVGLIYYNQYDFDEAIEFDMKALSFFEKLNNQHQKAFVLKAMSDAYLGMGDSAKAARCCDTALFIYKQLRDKKGEASVYINQARLCVEDYLKKIELHLQAEKILENSNPDDMLEIINNGNLGIAYLDIVRDHLLKKIRPSPLIPRDGKKLLLIAETYLGKAIHLSYINNDADDSSFFTGVMAELQNEKGDFKDAYNNFIHYYEIHDSIFSQKSKNRIASLESQRAIDIKNKELENKELQISNQKKNVLLLVSLIVFLSALGTLFYRQSLSRKKTNARLLQLNQELDEANKVKARFFGILSHDLRSPIANLINFLQLQTLKPGLLSRQQIAERENKIVVSAKSLLETMEATLLWSKGQMEHFKPDISLVPVKKLFDYLQQFFAGTEHIAFSFSDSENLVLETDANFLKTIMQNLTANAIQAVKQKANAQINWQAWEEEEKIFLSITDNGTGAGIQQLKALYDETADTGARHGLGLHIIRDLAKAIVCNITLKHEDGLGTTFVLSLNKTGFK